MIVHLLGPLLNLHGWEAYALVGALVFAEAGILIGFVFPGETAVILGRGGLAGPIEITARSSWSCSAPSPATPSATWSANGGTPAPRGPVAAPAAAHVRTVARPAEPAGRHRRLCGPLHRLPSCRRPGTGRHVVVALPCVPPRQRGGRRGLADGHCLLGYVVGSAYTKLEQDSAIVSDVLLGLDRGGLVVLAIRRRRKERKEQRALTPDPPAPTDPPTRAAHHSEEAPAASAPAASVSIHGPLRSDRSGPCRRSEVRGA